MPLFYFISLVHRIVLVVYTKSLHYFLYFMGTSTCGVVNTKYCHYFTLFHGYVDMRVVNTKYGHFILFHGYVKLYSPYFTLFHGCVDLCECWTQNTAIVLLNYIPMRSYITNRTFKSGVEYEPPYWTYVQYRPTHYLFCGVKNEVH